MATSHIIHTDCIRLRNKSDDSRLEGVSVSLLPNGETAPGGLIAISANAGLPHQYDFNVSIVDGQYTLYVNSTPAVLNGEPIIVHVIRGDNLDEIGGTPAANSITTDMIQDGAVTPVKTSFAEDF